MSRRVKCLFWPIANYLVRFLAHKLQRRAITLKFSCFILRSNLVVSWAFWKTTKCLILSVCLASKFLPHVERMNIEGENMWIIQMYVFFYAWIDNGPSSEHFDKFCNISPPPPQKKLSLICPDRLWLVGDFVKTVFFRSIFFSHLTWPILWKWFSHHKAYIGRYHICLASVVQQSQDKQQNQLVNQSISQSVRLECTSFRNWSQFFLLWFSLIGELWYSHHSFWLESIEWKMDEFQVSRRRYRCKWCEFFGFPMTNNENTCITFHAKTNDKMNEKNHKHKLFMLESTFAKQRKEKTLAWKNCMAK